MQQFDYVIVGAGSAGCLLANRLSADPQRRVLLLEAGKRDNNPNIHIPAAFSKLFQTSEDWAYHTTPQPAMHNRMMYQPRGKVIGGCSSINAMIYIRGHRQDYDTWADLGNQGWSYREVLPYFKRMENNLQLDDAYHGTAGELYVSDLVEKHPIVSAIIRSANKLGYPLNPDFNGRRQEGFGFYQVTQNRGRRWSAADAFLHPIRKRSNLKVQTNAQVTRFIWQNQTVVGVAYQAGGATHEVAVRQEAILSAGAFNSPHLLMLSGIGDAEQLNHWGIPVRKHLPGVGKNLQDHLLAGLSFRTSYENTLDTAERFPELARNVWNYLINKRGPFTSNIAEGGGFVRTRPGLSGPDLQFHLAACHFIRHGFDNPTKGQGFSIGPTLLQPLSRGSVGLKNAHPLAGPAIDPNYFDRTEDVETMIAGYRLACRIAAQPPLDQYRSRLFKPERILETNDEIADFLRRTSETLYHPVGTCKMGQDEQAVVDSQLRVHGVKGLRVVDASIMPVITRGNTQAPVMMIAEKAAELILQGQKHPVLQVQQQDE